MITVNIDYNDDDIIGFVVKGHADYGEHGEDILCAAVSAIVQTTVFGLIKYLQVDVDYKVEDGLLSCYLDCDLASNNEVKAILETMLIGLEETTESYPEYIKIIKGGGSNV